jgi:predicted RNA-binding Zn-ribbon protein involved in translation (DUF1610 family)
VAETRQFVCPACGAILNQELPGLIRMTAVLRGPCFSVRFPVDIPAELGVYGAAYDPRVALEEGCRVEFDCPSCGKDFTTAYSTDWAELMMVEGGHEYVVVFNRTYGERSSFLFDYSTKRLVGTYGNASQDYVAQFGKDINFFGS